MDPIIEVPKFVSVCQDLSLLVITCPKTERKKEFLPNELSTRVTEWFEGTGTIIGIKRNYLFILTSIHCIPTEKYSFFVKGKSSFQKQIPATLCFNHYEIDNIGLDVAILSCDINNFDQDIIKMVDLLQWSTSQTESTDYRFGNFTNVKHCTIHV